MKLSSTRRHWNRLACTDPLWAVFTEPGKEGNRWQIDGFFANDRNDIAAELARVRSRCPALRTGTALDFG